MLSKPFINNLKIHRKRISRWEKGSSVPSVINLFKLAALYGVARHELYPDIYHAIHQRVDHAPPLNTSESAETIKP